METVQKTIRIEESTYKEIERMAEEEDRKPAQMIKILIKEAMKARQS